MRADTRLASRSWAAALLLAVAPLRPRGNDFDGLRDWQKDFWHNDTEVVFMGVATIANNSRGCDVTGIYARSGQEPAAPGNDVGFKAPIESYWATPLWEEQHRWPMQPSHMRLWGFTVEDLGHNQTNVLLRAPELGGVLFRVRRLEERWVSMFLHDGQPVAGYFGWAKFKYVWGVPVGYEYFNIHAFKIKSCKIDYDDEVVVQIKSGSKTEWEMKRDMLYDPLCDCGPTPTCGRQEGTTCKELVSGALESRLLQSSAFSQYLDTLLHSPLQLEDLARDFSIGSLTNATCIALPGVLSDSMKEPFRACSDILLYDIIQRESAYLTDGGDWKGIAMSDAQMRSVLDTPRIRWLMCVQSQAQESLLAANSSKTMGQMEHIRMDINKIRSQLDQNSSEDDINTLLQKAAQLAVLALLCLWVVLRDCCPCFFRCCCRVLKRRTLQPSIELSNEEAEERGAELSRSRRQAGADLEDRRIGGLSRPLV